MKAIRRHLLPLPPVATDRSRNRTAYRRGASYERQIVDAFKQAGELAIRSAGSHSPYDVYVIRPSGGLAIQAKATTLTPAEPQIQRWLAAWPALPDGWHAELWLRVAGRPWQRFTNEMPSCREERPQ